MTIRVLDFADGFTSPAQEDNIGFGGVGAHEFVGTGDGVAKVFSVSNLPSNNESIIVYRNGSYVPTNQYSFDFPVLEFNVAPSKGQRIDVFMLTVGQNNLSSISASNQVVDYRQLNQNDINNKGFQLPSLPANPSKVIVDVVSGSAQIYGIDFTVSGTSLSWDSLGMENQITVGTYIRYHYFN